MPPSPFSLSLFLGGAPCHRHPLGLWPPAWASTETSLTGAPPCLVFLWTLGRHAWPRWTPDLKLVWCRGRGLKEEGKEEEQKSEEGGVRKSKEEEDE